MTTKRVFAAPGGSFNRIHGINYKAVDGGYVDAPIDHASMLIASGWMSAASYIEDKAALLKIDADNNPLGVYHQGGVVTGQMPIGVPAGLAWVADTLAGIDLYDKGFAKTPTIFFDPSNTTSPGLGTYRSPFTTQAQLQAVVSGNMAGHVLGIKRGTALRVTGLLGLLLTVYGTPSKPFTICPYGDAEALPIITGSAIVTAWTLVDAATNIWSYALGATQYDCWQSDVRLRAKAFSSSAINTLTAPGQSTYSANTLYVRPYNGEDPRNGQMEIPVCDAAFTYAFSNVAATGNVIICGLDARNARNSVFGAGISAGGSGNIVTADNVSIVGCRVSQGGTDGPTLGCDAIVVYGPSNSIRLTNLYIAGNYCHDVLNNAVEIAMTSGALVEKNTSRFCNGNSIIELWASNDNAEIRHNYGYYSTTLGRVQLGYASGGIWFANNYETGGGTNNNDTTNARNFNNFAHHNLIVLPGLRGIRASGGTGHKAQHNTVFFDELTTDPNATLQTSGIYCEGTGADGFIDVSNNLFYFKKDATHTRFSRLVDIQAATGRPTGDKNIYFSEGTGGGGDGLHTVEGTTNNVATYKSRMVTNVFDQNSLFGPNFIGSTVTVGNLGMNESTYEILAAGHTGVTSLVGIGTRYFDGKPYVPATPTIGALLGT
jgi:hypothetical protein